jgi:hypothetical protein
VDTFLLNLVGMHVSKKAPDGVEMPETGQSKRDRVKAARNAIGLDVESVKVLLQSHFEVSDPMQLSSEQVDELIGMFAAMTASK